MGKKLSYLCFFLLLTFTLEGCYYKSSIIKMTNGEIRSKLIAGSTSYVGLYSNFGNPTQVYINDNGCRHVIYKYKSKDKNYEQKDLFDQLLLVFDTEDRLVKYEFSIVQVDIQSKKKR